MGSGVVFNCKALNRLCGVLHVGMNVVFNLKVWLFRKRHYWHKLMKLVPCD